MPEEENKEIAGEMAACRQFGAELPAYLEGEHRPRVIAHARDCVYCGVVLSDLEGIRLQAGELPREDPPLRVWANIRATLAAEALFQEPASVWRGWFPISASLSHVVPFGAVACLVLVGLSLLVPPGSFEKREALDRLAARRTPTLASAVYPDENADLARTVGEMEKSYREQEKSFEPAVDATYLRSLDSLNASIRECLDSVRQEPANALAREYLLTAYKQKAELLASALEFDAR